MATGGSGAGAASGADVGSGGSDRGAALVRAGWTPGRAEPDHRSELVTQWLCGEALAVEERGPDGEWLRVRGPDGYRCWVSAGGVVETDAAGAGRWAEAADHVSLGVRLAPEGAGRAPRGLPWGSRVAFDGGSVGLPDGGTARPDPAGGLVPLDALGERFPGRPDAVAETALGWRGAPYLWGGRTPDGADCSGFVQAVLRLHGVELPRDSRDQLEATAAALVAGAAELESSGEHHEVGGVSAETPEPGDLLFFRGSDGGVTHVALALGESRIVHAASGRGGVAEDDLTAADPLCRRLAGRLVAVTRPLSLRG